MPTIKVRLRSPCPRDLKVAPVEITIFPKVTITTKGGQPQLTVADDEVKFIHDRKTYKRQEEQQKERANFRRELAAIQEEKERKYRYWKDYSPQQLEEAKAKMIPGPGQTIGMINPSTNLRELLTAQELELQQLGLTNEQLATAMNAIFTTYVAAGAEGRLEEDELGQFAHKDSYRIYRWGEVGYQACPFGCETARHFIHDYVVVDTTNKTALFLADTHPHLVLHGFYEESMTEPVTSSLQQEDLTKISLGAMFHHAAATIAVTQELQSRMMPHQQRGNEFINLPLKETAYFLRIGSLAERSTQ